MNFVDNSVQARTNQSGKVWLREEAQALYEAPFNDLLFQAHVLHRDNFDPNKVYVNPSTPRAYTSGHLNLAQLNPFYATSRFVPKGTSSTLNGAVIAVVSTSTTPDPAKEANNTSYFLAYDTPAGDQGVSLVKKDPNRTSWPSTSDCTMIVY